MMQTCRPDPYDTGTIVELVKKDDVDFGIVLDNEDFSAFHSHEIFKERVNLQTCRPDPYEWYFH
jgi:hypothetical protein